MNDSDKQFGGHKIFQHMDRLAAWQSGTLPPPVTVELDVTNLCNHACPGCTFSYLVNISKDSIEMETAERVIDEMGQMDVKAVTFSGGGEPLVYGEKRLLSLMRRVRDNGMDCALITNGSRITSREYLDLCTWLRISLDGYDEDTFARFHGRSEQEFSRVIECTRFICQENEKSGRPCTVGAGFLTDQDSLARDDFRRMSAFCAEFPGLDYLQFRPLVINMVADPSLDGGYAGFSGDDAARIYEAYQEARELYARDDYKVLISAGKYHALSQPGYGKEYSRCLGHFLEATISADSKVYICCHTQGQEQFCLGDLREESFHDIWYGERARRVYESFDPRETCPAACRLHLQNNVLHAIQQGVTHGNFI